MREWRIGVRRNEGGVEVRSEVREDWSEGGVE